MPGSNPLLDSWGCIAYTSPTLSESSKLKLDPLGAEKPLADFPGLNSGACSRVFDRAHKCLKMKYKSGSFGRW
ncbi:MAG: hypothetical protein COX62_05685 [Deltaproteobacteria bacterium CG_4_10_14_0_2_um_filter_43_8]|nr:MAG: hypothetical protein COV43_04040 [Deltaproteobacteria bacterium CG11_big_fil_rev_8_21_14_0_20_42_23]PJA19918.1 MAG: hypothetical protein COX62_05685 [Deltaproteobacteria bacterium CG_4_10_14_0_2_um_filter_43_8]